MNSVCLYFKMIRVSIRAQLMYRASFVMLALGNMLSALTDYLGILALFSRFGTVAGWSFAEVGLIYGMGHMAFAFAEAFTREFDVFQNHVRTGNFDRVLLRPRSTVLQMLGAQFQLHRIGRFLQGGIALSIALRTLQLEWNALRVTLLIASVMGGTLLFSGLIVLQATSCFWVIESLEVWNTVTFGGITAAQYPISIYHKPIRYLFTFIVPMAAINYWPCAYLLGRSYAPLWLSFGSPVVGCLFFALSLLVWQIGVRRYASTGS